MALRDDEDTVRIRKSSIPMGVFSPRTPVSCQPDPHAVHRAVDQLQTNWLNEHAALRQENEALRNQVHTLREENGALRDTLNKVRGR